MTVLAINKRLQPTARTWALNGRPRHRLDRCGPPSFLRQDRPKAGPTKANQGLSYNSRRLAQMKRQCPSHRTHCYNPGVRLDALNRDLYPIGLLHSVGQGNLAVQGLQVQTLKPVTQGLEVLLLCQ